MTTGRRGWCGVLLTMLLVTPLAAAQPAPPVELSGATFADLDEATGVWTLRGAPVTVRRGPVTIQAPLLTYDRRAQIVRAAGGVRYTDAALVIEAPQITAWLAEDRLVAEAGVTAEQRIEQLRLTAGRLEAFNRERRLLATGDPVLVAPEGRLAADRIEVFAARGDVVAEGNGRFAFEQIEGRAPHITVRQQPPTAVLSGGAVVRQGPNELQAATVTVDLQRRRMTAQGSAVVTVHPGR